MQPRARPGCLRSMSLQRAVVVLVTALALSLVPPLVSRADAVQISPDAPKVTGTLKTSDGWMVMLEDTAVVYPSEDNMDAELTVISGNRGGLHERIGSCGFCIAR